MSFLKAAAASVLALAAAACTTPDDPARGGSCAGNAAATLSAVNWDEALVVDVRIRQDEFVPAVFGLLRDRPYVLRITNEDDGSHGFSAGDFLQSVAVDTATVDGTPLENTCLSSISLPQGASAELRLVALRDGQYPFSTPGLVSGVLGYDTGRGRGTIFVQ